MDQAANAKVPSLARGKHLHCLIQGIYCWGMASGGVSTHLAPIINTRGQLRMRSLWLRPGTSTSHVSLKLIENQVPSIYIFHGWIDVNKMFETQSSSFLDFLDTLPDSAILWNYQFFINSEELALPGIPSFFSTRGATLYLFVNPKLELSLPCVASDAFISTGDWSRPFSQAAAPLPHVGPRNHGRVSAANPGPKKRHVDKGSNDLQRNCLQVMLN